MRKITKSIICLLFIFGMAFTAFAKEKDPVENTHYIATIDDESVDFYFLENYGVLAVFENDWEDTYGSTYYYDDELVYIFDDPEYFLDFEDSVVLEFDSNTKELVSDEEDVTLKFIKSMNTSEVLVGKTYSCTMDGETMKFTFKADNIVIIEMEDNYGDIETVGSRYIYVSDANKVILFSEASYFMDMDESLVLDYNAKKDVLKVEMDGEKLTFERE